MGASQGGSMHVEELDDELMEETLEDELDELELEL